MNVLKILGILKDIYRNLKPFICSDICEKLLLEFKPHLFSTIIEKKLSSKNFLLPRSNDTKNVLANLAIFNTWMSSFNKTYFKVAKKKFEPSLLFQLKKRV